MAQFRAYLEALVWLGLGLQGYHYLGYPLIIALLARLRPRPVRVGGVTPAATLIIAAYNEEATIGAKLLNSLELDYPELQIIVANDGSTDSTGEIIDSFLEAGVVGVHCPIRGGKAAALNEAVRIAHGEIVIFSDSNALYAVDAIRCLAAALCDPEVGCASGSKMLTAPRRGSTSSQGEKSYWRYEARLKRLETRIGSTSGVIGAMLAIRRSSFRPFPPNLVNEDAYLALATMCRGERTVFVPEALCWGSATARMTDDSRRRVRMAAGRYQLFFAHRLLPWRRPLDLFMLASHKLLRLIMPLLMAIAISANAAAAMIPESGWVMRVLLLGQLAFFALAGTGAYSGAAPKAARLAWYILAGHISSLRGLLYFLRGDAFHLWQKAERELFVPDTLDYLHRGDRNQANRFEIIAESTLTEHADK